MHSPDRYELLNTKLALPRPRPALVTREPLLARLDKGLERKLTLLSAPAGFGKTMLVSEWIASHIAHQDMSPVAWVSLDAGDNDPVRFWRYLLTASQKFQTDVGKAALTLLHASQRPSFEAVLTAFLNELVRLPVRGVLVLEDYHVITSHQVHETLAFLLDHLPATLHLVIITRSDPPLPLARLRAYDELSELHAADLRFSPAETSSFLQQALPFQLSIEASTHLAMRVEGWVAGLRLVALALQGRQDPQEIEHVLATFRGSHRHILEYLVAEVLAAQPEALQAFLLSTSILSRLTGPLCDAVTGGNHGALLLGQLEQANLFLVALDETGQWYRYHALFAEAMQHEARQRLGEDQLRTLYAKASRWYEEHGLLAEAVEAALSASAFARAAMLIERISAPDGLNYELHTLRRWIGSLPEKVLRTHPSLCLTDAVAILFTTDRSAPATLALLETSLEMAEQYWRAEDNQEKLGEVLAFRSQVAWWQGDLLQSFTLAGQALELLPKQSIFWRGTSMLSVGIDRLFAGVPGEAQQVTLEAKALLESVGNTYGIRAALFVLGEACSGQGELYQAARLYQRLLVESGEDFLDGGTALLRLAALSYEWNQLEAAEQQVSQALDLGRQHLDEIGQYHAEQFLLLPSSLVLARIQHARGETTQAQQLLHELIALAQERRWPQLHREGLLCQARIWLSTGDLAAVQRWVITYAQHSEGILFVQQKQEAMLIARLLLAQGKGEEALRLLEHWRTEIHQHGRTSSELEIVMLVALARLAHNQLPQAKQALLQVLTLAQTEGYQRLFLEEGETMATLLRSLLPDVREEPLATYIRSLLLAFAPQHEEKRPVATSLASSLLLIEPLSAQERRVLRLLSAGLSNPEIAQELVVSINTIKTQIQSIYRKLNVNSRKEAREVAHHLKLI